MIACEKDHAATARLLLEQHGAAINLKANDGATALYAACGFDQAACVKLLLQNGADTNQAANSGATPLWIAAENGHVEPVRLLLERGVNANQTVSNGCSALWYACQNDEVVLARLLLEHGANVNQIVQDATLLLVACQIGALDLVRLLLAHGADVKQAMNNGAGPLHIACQNGLVDIVRLLLEYGADANQVSNHGCAPYTPLLAASTYGHDAVVELLREHAAAVARGLKDEASRAPPETCGSENPERELYSCRRAREKRTCEKCGAVAALSAPKLLRCAGCHRTRYCSRACQKAHWKNRHREECA